MPHQPSRVRRRVAAVLTAIVGSAVGGGCGVGAGEAPAGVTLRVSQDHGRAVLLDRPTPELAGEGTVLQLLQRNAEIETRYSGTYVQAIDGLAAETGGGTSLDWVYYVDGVLAERGASSWKLKPGDRVWWDRHDTSGTPLGSPAVVGSYPAPLVGGFDGRNASVAVDCAAPQRAACALVKERLGRVGATLAPAGDLALPATDRRRPERVLVGTIAEVVERAGLEGRMLEQGPKGSGVFLRPVSTRAGSPADGIETYDGQRRPVRRLEAGAGVVAATRAGVRAPVWFVTGVDEQGVRRAAKALDERALAGHAAVVVDRDGVSPLPEAAAG